MCARLPAQAAARRAAAQPRKPEARADSSTNGVQEQGAGGSSAVLRSTPSDASQLPCSSPQDGTAQGHTASDTGHASSDSAAQDRHAGPGSSSGADAEAGGGPSSGGAGHVGPGSGRAAAQPAEEESFSFTKGCYFLGKAVWGKARPLLLISPCMMPQLPAVHFRARSGLASLKGLHARSRS